MASRTPLLLAAACFLIPSAVFAQAAASAAPPEADTALRARVTEFFQDFVDGKFRLAINLVADDTQDFYFSSPKLEMVAFKIQAISYSNNFTSAVVNLSVTRVLRLKAEGFLQDTNVDGPMETTWKIENGKWVFYDKPKTSGWVTPMGPSAELKQDASATPAKKIDEASMQAEARRILNQRGAGTSLMPGEVTLALDKPSSTKLVFHNGEPGSVGISLSGLPRNLPGFSAKLEKQTLNAGEDAAVELRYDPPAGQGELPRLKMVVTVAPFGVEYPVQVNFAPSNK